MRASRGLKPMATPAGTVQSALKSRAELTRRKVGHSAAEAMLLRSGKGFGGPASAPSEQKRQPADKGMKEAPIQPDDERSATDQIAQRGMRGAGTFHLLEFEFVRPEDDGTPGQLVQ